MKEGYERWTPGLTYLRPWAKIEWHKGRAIIETLEGYRQRVSNASTPTPTHSRTSKAKVGDLKRMPNCLWC